MFKNIDVKQINVQHWEILSMQRISVHMTSQTTVCFLLQAVVPGKNVLLDSLIFQDKKIASVPYHALAPADRETYNGRNKLLEHLAQLLRKQAVEEETKRFKAEDELGIQSE